MIQIKEQKELSNQLYKNFGKLVVILFHAQWNEQSQQFQQ